MDEGILIPEIIRIPNGYDVDDMACTDRPAELQYLWPPDVKIMNSLPTEFRDKAINYITLCVADLPFNVRWYWAEPMWLRFIDVWNDTRNFEKAMRAI